MIDWKTYSISGYNGLPEALVPAHYLEDPDLDLVRWYRKRVATALSVGHLKCWRRVRGEPMGDALGWREAQVLNKHEGWTWSWVRYLDEMDANVELEPRFVC